MFDLYLPETPSQTAGPYVHIGLIPNQAGFDIFENNFGGDIAGPNVAGERILIEGRIFDASGHVAKDVLVETWQANAAGRYNHPTDRQDKALDQNFRGWARTGTDFRRLSHQNHQARPGRRTARPQDHGATCQLLDRFPRHQYRARDTDVFRRRGRRQRW
jgi:protocatechuate 3,4-dioxygenase alpha subunit